MQNKIIVKNFHADAFIKNKAVCKKECNEDTYKSISFILAVLIAFSAFRITFLSSIINSSLSKMLLGDKLAFFFPFEIRHIG